MSGSIEKLTLHLTRPPVFSLLCGGVDRICVSFVPQTNVVSDSAYGEVRDWRSEGFVKEFRLFRKLGIPHLDEAVWNLVCDTAFPGVPYEDWEGDDVGRSEPAGAVHYDDWTASLDVRISTEPFGGATATPIVLTGPYAHRLHHIPEMRDLDPPIIAWLHPPHLDRRFEGERGPDPGTWTKAYWSSRTMVGAWLHIRRLLPGMPEGVRNAIGKAAADGIASGSDGRPDIEWSREVPLWIGLREPTATSSSD